MQKVEKRKEKKRNKTDDWSANLIGSSLKKALSEATRASKKVFGSQEKFGIAVWLVIGLAHKVF